MILAIKPTKLSLITKQFCYPIQLTSSIFFLKVKFEDVKQAMEIGSGQVFPLIFKENLFLQAFTTRQFIGSSSFQK